VDSPFLQCLIALHGSNFNPWEISRLVQPAPNMGKLTELNHRFSQLPSPLQQRACARLVSDHPEEFRQAVEAVFGQNRATRVELRCCFYLPEYWRQLSMRIPRGLNNYLGRGWGVEFGEAGENFLTRLPAELLALVLGDLSDAWWWEGHWTPALQQAVWRSTAREVQLQLAMLAGDEPKVSGLLTADLKRQGYGAVWEFLQGKPEAAYLSWQKLIARRRAGSPVFPLWVAPWARLTALVQGDMALFQDSRLMGMPGIDASLDEVGIKLPDHPPIELGRGLEDCYLWFVRHRLPYSVTLKEGAREYWQAQGMHWLAEQLQEKPAHPWVPAASQEEGWQTFLRLLDTQADLLSKPAATGSKGGALLWHLFPPEIVYYHDKSASHDQGPAELGGKHVNSKTLFSRMPDYLNDQDRIAMGKVKFSSYGSALLNVEVLRALVGHPRVYKLDQPLKLSERVQQLRLERGALGISLKLNPEIPAGRDFLLEEDGTFWTRSPIEKQLLPLLQQQAPVPLSAEKELRQVLNKWGQRIEIEAGAGLTPIRQSSARADRLLLRARPTARGLRFDWLVGSSELPDYHRMALEGAAQERLSQTEGIVVVERDLAWEQREWERLLALCPALPAATSFRSDALADLLDILQECRQANVALEWPEGQPWRVRGARGLNVAVKSLSGEDWFTLEGSLQLEQGGSLELAAALQAARLGGDGSYLKLGEHDYVRLDDELRRQLEGLADLADADQPRIPALAVPSLAELEVTGLTSDQAFQERLEQFQECARYQPTVPKRLQAELRDYQVEGFRWLARHARMGTGACLADDMGLGKTLQAIALMLHQRGEGPHLVVCPVSVLAQWAQQIEQFAPTLRAHGYEGKDRELSGLKAGDVVLCSYGVLLRDAKKLTKVKWAVAVLDEAQAIKNPQSKTARCAYQLQAAMRVATTGTPIENRLSELWSLFAFLNPGLLGTLAAFRRRYEEAGAGRSRLRSLIAPFLLRRLKSQVLSELPPRTEITLNVQLGDQERALYEQVRAQAQSELEDGQSLDLLAHLTRLRQACCHPRLILGQSDLRSSKLDTLFELLEELQAGNHRALVFSQFTRFLDLVEAQLKERSVTYQRLDGSTPAKERQKRVAAFQEGEGDLFLISLKAGGTGLNLTGADYVIHLDPWWNPAVEDQASDRAHRIGQHRPVTIYRLVAEQTLEEKVVRLHGHKRDLAQSVLEGSDQATPLSVAELRDLLRLA
jgi:superfamily II DNA or RNA helicase